MRTVERIRARVAREDGVAALEFAIVSMLFLVILFGILTYGYIYSMDQSMTHAAEEGARAAIATTTDAAAISTAQTTAYNRLSNYQPSLQLSDITAVIVNNAASGYVKALQHSMFGKRYQSSDLVEMDYAAVAEAMGCRGIRVEDPQKLGEALRHGMAERDRPTVIDVVVTRDAGKMLPAVDSRTVEIKKGDRVA